MQRLFPKWLFDYISNNFILEYIYEIRIRLNKPIIINYCGKYEVLYEKNTFKPKSIICNNELINYIMTVATKQSMYAYNEEIKHCYVQFDGGIRIGICGTVVYNNDKILTIKNITSLNIRIAHEILNCSKKIIDLLCFNGIVKNTLIISPPGQGKTTFIRDIANQLSNKKQINNILIIDERYEISGGYLSEIDIGLTTDVITGCNKSFAFLEAIKTMNPTVMITDEISSESDIESIKQTIRSGVKVIATAHAENINDIKTKKYFESIISEKYFERIIVLSGRNGVGTIEGVFDENFRVLYVPYLK